MLCTLVMYGTTFTMSSRYTRKTVSRGKGILASARRSMSERRRLAPRGAAPNAARRVVFAAFVTLLALAIGVAPRPARAGDPFEIQVYDGTANTPGVFGLE